MKAQKQPSRIKPLPAHQAYEGGCKVHWLGYAKKEDAEAASKLATENAKVMYEMGYDSGYCSPGQIMPPGKSRFPGLYSVCIL